MLSGIRVGDYLKILYHHSPEGTEENYEEPQSV
jgi:hypothetical protein